MKNGGGAEEEESAAAVALKKGPWTAAEDAILIEYVKKYGEGNWNAVQRNGGLNRCGKSCRLRWANHLRPNLKKGAFTAEEELLILQLHAQLGNKWARMAAQLPGRTDNEIKNYWNTRIKRRKRAGIPLYPPEVQRQVCLRQGLHLRPPGANSSASPVPPTPPPATVPRARLRPPPLSLLNPITLPSSPSPTSATASVPLLNQFSNGLVFQFPLSSPLSPPALSLLQPQHRPRQQFSASCPVSPAPPPQQFSVSSPVPQFSVSCPVSPAPLHQFPFSCPVSPTVQGPLFQSQQPMHCNLGSFDVNPSPSFVQMPFQGELPSSQIPGETGGGGAGIGPFQSTSSGLLDDMIRELQRGGEAPRADRHPQLAAAAGGQGGDGHRGGNDVSRPSHVSVLDSLAKPDRSNSSINGIEMRNEVENEINPVHEDISTLFDMMPAPAMAPATMAAPDWYHSDSGEISNGPSSVMTDDDIGLEMHQLASSLSLPPVDRGRNASSCAWNDDTSGIL